MIWFGNVLYCTVEVCTYSTFLESGGKGKFGRKGGREGEREGGSGDSGSNAFCYVEGIIACNYVHVHLHTYIHTYYENFKKKPNQNHNKKRKGKKRNFQKYAKCSVASEVWGGIQQKGECDYHFVGSGEGKGKEWGEKLIYNGKIFPLSF